jgi:Transglutaminase-like superfamily
MSVPVALQRGRRPGLRRRIAAAAAVSLARLLGRLPPRRLRALLLWLRAGARAASHDEALAARDAVVAVSVWCAGQGCLARSRATALLCRLDGTWPTLCVGVRTEPFAAHAWVEAGGRPVRESFPGGYYHLLITVPPRHRDPP